MAAAVQNTQVFVDGGRNTAPVKLLAVSAASFAGSKLLQCKRRRRRCCFGRAALAGSMLL